MRRHFEIINYFTFKTRGIFEINIKPCLQNTFASFQNRRITPWTWILSDELFIIYLIRYVRISYTLCFLLLKSFKRGKKKKKKKRKRKGKETKGRRIPIYEYSVAHFGHKVT
jgi:large-conductance mechanosensitive channel